MCLLCKLKMIVSYYKELKPNMYDFGPVYP